MDRLGPKDRILDVKISSVESLSPLRPHGQSKSDGLLHLPNAHSGTRREFPATLAVFCLEIAGTDTERQPPSADDIDTGGDLGRMRGIAVVDRRSKRAETKCDWCIHGDGPRSR